MAEAMFAETKSTAKGQVVVSLTNDAEEGYAVHIDRRHDGSHDERRVGNPDEARTLIGDIREGQFPTE